MMQTDNPTALPTTLVALLKGVVYQEADSQLWQSISQLQSRIRDHMALMGLALFIDEAEGYAFLRQREPDPDAPLPRLVVKRQISYPVSLLLALLRRKMSEFDATGGDTRLILSRDDMLDLVQVFLPGEGNEARRRDQFDSTINKVVDLGFLRRLHGQDNTFEVRRILKAFVDAQWLANFSEQLDAYKAHALESDS